MSRLYDETQDFLQDGQYNGDYAMCSVNRQSCNGITKRQPVSYPQMNTEQYARPHTQMASSLSYALQSRTSRRAKCQPQVDAILRACLAEFLAVYATTFLSVYLDDELLSRHVPWIQKIVLMAVTDAMAATLFISALKTIHFHPAVTIAHLFSLTTSWFQCLFIIIIQLLAATSANLTIVPMRKDGLPAYVVVNNDINMEWTKTVYKLMFSQFLGTAFVVVAHLMSCSPLRKNALRIGSLNESSCPLFMAISLSSFLSLLQSTSHWNSLQATTIALLRSFSMQATESLYEQYIFWLGPLIGSLLACFLYRLLKTAHKGGYTSQTDHHENIFEPV
ncbi:unnamed protein product [Strongylus vulgaris]|uniref:Aquaporin n=1 Tax=Strongylus vulgaris TaxID=40348 RepID=A0A3P7INB0_STRVU|nr:unnamed protein product [Strongylus vulgaris]